MKDQINTKDQLIACKSMTVDGLKKEAESCKQEVKAMGVALEIKEFELEQLREFKLLVKSERGVKFIHISTSYSRVNICCVCV